MLADIGQVVKTILHLKIHNPALSKESWPRGLSFGLPLKGAVL
jgi:hypothetical protein